MDQKRFVDVVKQFPQVWDRNCVTFREQTLKNEAWDRIGEIMGCPASVAKDVFKSLREKYVREREKQIMFGEKYIPWEFLEILSFLNPHIILRKQSTNYENTACKNAENSIANLSQDSNAAQFFDNYSEFDKALILMVRKATPIWDRRSNGYPSKQVKYQLWKEIAMAMNKEMDICMLRWKGLREKYIRQKNKYLDGDGKWEFLDDMSFLDKVIQYRRKNTDPLPNYRVPNMTDPPNFSFNSSPNAIYDDNSIHDSSSNEFGGVIKNEEYTSDLQDSSYDSGTGGCSRKRSASNHSDSSSCGKREKYEESSHRNPEVMFGELVAVMLAKKSEREKNIAMIEIMQILTK